MYKFIMVASEIHILIHYTVVIVVVVVGDVVNDFIHNLEKSECVQYK